LDFPVPQDSMESKEKPEFPVAQVNRVHPEHQDVDSLEQLESLVDKDVAVLTDSTVAPVAQDLRESKVSLDLQLLVKRVKSDESVTLVPLGDKE